MDRGRFSFMGAVGGPLWRMITYHLPPPPAPHQNTATPLANGYCNGGAQLDQPSTAAYVGSTETTQEAGSTGSGVQGTVCVEDAQGHVTTHQQSFFSYLRELLSRHKLQLTQEAAEQLPFNFWGGLVGYLGYELKAECGGVNAHASPTPDAAMLFADRLLAIDHKTGDVFIVAVFDKQHGDASSAASAQEWLASMQDKVQHLCAGKGNSNGSSQGGTQASVCSESHLHVNGTGDGVVPAHKGASKVVNPFRLRHDKQQYVKNIEHCLSALHSGESYEVCLTTALLRQGAPYPPELYKTLRVLNPAPYSAWLQLGNAGPTLCCSSPERFLRGDRGGILEARPIKGTAARHLTDTAADAAAAAELAGSEKDRAENLMIVDLLRNDLGAVCEVGSVHVPGLMEIESYATVHQMVSTVRGARRQDKCVVDCIQAAFPAGSMTGAPKVRTMQIIDELEGAARGVYSGCIGFISLNDCFDLNVVIRTALMHGPAVVGSRAGTSPAQWEDLQGMFVSIGAGGAIVVQSDAEGEFAEMRLKARALLAALGRCDGTPGPAVLDDSVQWGAC